MVASVVRALAGGPGACRMSSRGKLARRRSGPSEPLCSACTPRFCPQSPQAAAPRNTVRRLATREPGGLAGAMRDALVTLPAPVPHRPTRSDVRDAAHVAHTHLWADWRGSLRVFSAQHSCPSRLSMLCLGVRHHASRARQRVRTGRSHSAPHAASFRTTLLSGDAENAVFTFHVRRGHEGRASGWLARMCLGRLGAATSLRRHGILHPLPHLHVFDSSGCKRHDGDWWVSAAQLEHRPCPSARRVGAGPGDSTAGWPGIVVGAEWACEFKKKSA